MIGNVFLILHIALNLFSEYILTEMSKTTERGIRKIKIKYFFIDLYINNKTICRSVYK